MVAKIRRTLKKGIVIVLMLCSFSCSTYRKAETYKHIAQKGYVGMKFKFSDSGNRCVEIEFISDSTLTIGNKPSIAQNYYLLSFNNIYTYTKLEIGSIFISGLLSGDKELSKAKYVKPYSTRQYALNNNEAIEVFPDLEGDTIRFSSDFRKLQAKEFCLDRVNE